MTSMGPILVRSSVATFAFLPSPNQVNGSLLRWVCCHYPLLGRANTIGYIHRYESFHL